VESELSMQSDSQPAHWLAGFHDALVARDKARLQSLFLEECYWRDFLAFTWNIVTLEGHAPIWEMLLACLDEVKPEKWEIESVDAPGDAVGAWFSFDTAVGRGKGHLRLKDGRCWTFFTTLRELKGHEEKRGPTRIPGAQHGVVKGRRVWLDGRNDDKAELGISRQPYCLIVGGGQGGLALAARLKQLGVPTLIVDALPRPGDGWRRRYRSLCLHDPVWYDHMPYLPFPDNWPVYTPKDKMGDWLEAYASIMELDIWNATRCTHAAFDDATKRWTVEVERDGQTITLQPTQLVLATGMAGVPNRPVFKGQDRFRGIQHHSSEHKDGAPYAGKRCVIVGANNSAHDIAADLWENGASVTMIQRSPTLVVKSSALERYGRPLYSEAAVAAGIDADRADLIAASIPYRILPQFAKPTVARIRQDDADFYERLGATGFMLTFGEDESGIGLMYPRRGAGYYIDVGASDLIIDGRIAVKSGVEIDHLAENAVVMADGTTLPADLIVYATGYGPMNDWAAELISPAVAEKVGPCWGLGSGTAKDSGPWEGELRNMWKPTRQEALWFQGGNLQQARHFSLYTALQIKARMEGVPTPVYRTG
jgi:putative flavoprotein involved in K+ transport